MAATNPLCYYTRVSGVNAEPTDNEKRLLTAGTAGTDYKGTLTFAANSLAIGDVIRVTAWGRWTNSDTLQNGTAQLRLYFNSTNPANQANPLHDTTSTLTPLSTQVPWWLQANLTIKPLGGSNATFGQGLIQNVEDPWAMNFNKMSPLLNASVDVTVANYMDMTALVTTQGLFRLDHCLIERFPVPS